ASKNYIGTSTIEFDTAAASRGKAGTAIQDRNGGLYDLRSETVFKLSTEDDVERFFKEDA
ncbi:hypothetical protein HDU98_005901, partial [Podochytrium sp. JEL0797]